jgi:hypothetical protein
MAEVVLLKSEVLAPITKNYSVSEGYATSAASSCIIQVKTFRDLKRKMAGLIRKTAGKGPTIW